MSDEIAELIAAIENYCRKAEISESTFGRQVVNDGKFVSRLRNGKGVTLKTLNKTREYIRTHPPGPERISEQDAALTLAPAHKSAARALKPATLDEQDQIADEKQRLPFRFYDNRQKYLAFVHTCNEKWAISQRAGKEISQLQPRYPALRVFDAGMGDGTVLAYLMQNLHRQFPTVPLFINAKEMSLEDVRLGLAKLPDRFCEHPPTVVVISNLYYDEAPWLMLREDKPQTINWHDVQLEGNCAHEYGEQIEALHSVLVDGWQTRPSSTSSNRLYVTPSVLVLYRADQKFLLQSSIPPPGSMAGEYDLVLASQPWQARVSAEFKIKRILAPLAKSLAVGGRLLGIQSYGDDPGLEIVQSIWPDENPFTINRHVLLQVLKDELGPLARNFQFNAMSDAKSVFRYEMHTLPTEIGDHMGTSTLFAAWNAAIYVNQIEDAQLEEAVAAGKYLEVTRRVLKRRKGLWFNDETFVVVRKRRET